MDRELAWADGYPGDDVELGEIFCLTFVRDADPTEALLRMGGMPDTIATRTPEDIGELHDFDAGYPDVGCAVALGEGHRGHWSVVFEPDGFEGASLVETVSRGGEAVSLLRHDYASPRFGYAVDGELVTAFDPTFPDMRHGSDPDRLLEWMRELGFDVDTDDGDFDDAFSRSLRLIERITGVLPTYGTLIGPLTSAYLEPWFTDEPKPRAQRVTPEGPIDVDAVTEVRRLAEKCGLTGTPGLADTLAAVERGEAPRVPHDGPLGGHVRDWLVESRRAGVSLNDAEYRMTEEQRYHGFDLGWLTRALGAAIQRNRT